MNDTQLAQHGELHVPVSQGAIGQIGPIAGIVTHQIGSGDNAQNAIIYRTIMWCFITGGALSAAFAHFLLKESTSHMSEVKDLWSIFVPLITLALGYIFGKWISNLLFRGPPVSAVEIQ